MNGNRGEQFELLLNAHLDGRLTDQQAAEFERLLGDDAGLRAELELQSRIDSALRRLFEPEAASAASSNGSQPGANGAAAYAPASGDTATTPPARKAAGRRFRWAVPASLAAAIALAAYVAYDWPREPAFIMSELQLEPHTFEAFYAALKEQDFDTDWECDDDRDFAAFVHRRLKHGLMLAAAPSDVQVLGLTYGWTLSRKSVHLSAKVRGRGVVVFADRLDNADRVSPTPACKLRLFERRTERFVLYELTPFDEPRLLDLFYEVEVPDEWLRRGYGGGNGGRVLKDGAAAPQD